LDRCRRLIGPLRPAACGLVHLEVRCSRWVMAEVRCATCFFSTSCCMTCSFSTACANSVGRGGVLLLLDLVLLCGPMRSVVGRGDIVPRCIWTKADGRVRRDSDHGLRETEVDGSQREPLGSVILEEQSGSASGVNIHLQEPLCSLLPPTKQRKNGMERLCPTRLANQTLPKMA
jgi:hypothetical protein